MSGAVGLPINFRFGPNEVEYIVNHSDTKVLFIDAEYLEMIHSIKDSMKNVEMIVVVDSNGELPHDFIEYDSIYETSATYRPCETLIDDDP